MVACEPHWATLSMDTSVMGAEDREVVDRNFARIRTNLKNPNLGIGLKALFKRAGLKDIQSSAYVLVGESQATSFLFPIEDTTTPEEDKVILRRLFDQLDQEGLYYVTLVLYVVSGRKD